MTSVRKKCNTCGKRKAVSQFSPDTRNRDRLQGTCRQCHTERLRAYREANPGAAQWSNYKTNARARKLKFGLTREQVEEMIRQPCHYCGGEGFGIDRRDNRQGYIEDNVVPCCTNCNQMKSSRPADEFLSHCQKIAEHQSRLQQDD